MSQDSKIPRFQDSLTISTRSALGKLVALKKTSEIIFFIFCRMFYQVENVDLFLWTAQKLSMPKRNPDDGMMVPADLRH